MSYPLRRIAVIMRVITALTGTRMTIVDEWTGPLVHTFKYQRLYGDLSIFKNFLSFGLAISVASLFFSQPANALPVDFIDNGSFTTDSLSGLDWIDRDRRNVFQSGKYAIGFWRTF